MFMHIIALAALAHHSPPHSHITSWASCIHNVQPSVETYIIHSGVVVDNHLKTLRRLNPRASQFYDGAVCLTPAPRNLGPDLPE